LLESYLGILVPHLPRFQFKPISKHLPLLLLVCQAKPIV
jgi:hypothetical protein